MKITKTVKVEMKKLQAAKNKEIGSRNYNEAARIQTQMDKLSGTYEKGIGCYFCGENCSCTD